MKDEQKKGTRVSRRNFVKIAGAAGVGASALGTGFLFRNALLLSRRR